MADPNQPKEDYLDKGLDAVEKQFGSSLHSLSSGVVDADQTH